MDAGLAVLLAASPTIISLTVARHWRCTFSPHSWRHVSGGIWQCRHCKELSVGAEPLETPHD